MKFGPIPVEQAEGKILAHNIPRQDGRRAFRKGKTLNHEDVLSLQGEGHVFIYAAQLEPGDIDEDTAARRVATTAMGAGLRLKWTAEGKSSLAALVKGVLRVDIGRLEQVNRCEGIAFASLPSFAIVDPDQVVATVKIIPYGLSSQEVEQAERCAQGATALIEVCELKPRRVGLVFCAYPAYRERLIATYTPPLQKRIERFGSTIAQADVVTLTGSHDDEQLASILSRQITGGIEAIILISETSTMDANDIAPRALSSAGGQVVCVGAPVDPGNLLMLAYVGAIPVMGVPGCARSSRPNVIDYLLPALLSGSRLTRTDIARLGNGGLLEED